MSKFEVTHPTTGKTYTIFLSNDEDIEKLTPADLDDIISGGGAVPKEEKPFSPTGVTEPKKETEKSPFTLAEEMQKARAGLTGRAAEIAGPLPGTEKPVTGSATEGLTGALNAALSSYGKAATLGATEAIPGMREFGKELSEKQPLATAVGTVAGYATGVGPNLIAKAATGLVKKILPKLAGVGVSAATGALAGGSEAGVESLFDKKSADRIAKDVLVGSATGGAAGAALAKIGAVLDASSTGHFKKLFGVKETKDLVKELGPETENVLAGKYGVKMKDIYRNLDTEISSLDDQLSAAVKKAGESIRAERAVESAEAAGKARAAAFRQITGRPDVSIPSYVPELKTTPTELVEGLKQDIATMKIPGFQMVENQAVSVLDNVKKISDRLGIEELTPENIVKLKTALKKEVDVFKTTKEISVESTAKANTAKLVYKTLLKKLGEESPEAVEIGQKMNRLIELRDLSEVAIDARKGDLHVAPSNILFLAAALANTNPVMLAIYAPVVGGALTKTTAGTITSQQLSKVLSNPQTTARISALLGSGIGNIGEGTGFTK